MLLCTIQLDASLHQLLLSGGCPDEVVNVLVEVHFMHFKTSGAEDYCQVSCVGHFVSGGN